MSAVEDVLRGYIGRRGRMRVGRTDKMLVDVIVEDARFEYGNWRLQVTPVSGEGSITTTVRNVVMEEVPLV